MQERTPPSGRPSEDMLYEMALKVLDKQIDTIDSLDAKLSGALAFIAVVFAALATFVSSQSSKPSGSAVILFWTALLAFFTILVLGALAYRVRKVKYLLEGTRLQGIANLKLASTFLKARLLEHLTNQLEHNKVVLQGKARLVQWAILLSFVELLLIIALTLVTALSNNPGFFQVT